MNAADAAPRHRREATVRALATGAAIGLLLAAAWWASRPTGATDK